MNVSKRPSEFEHGDRFADGRVVVGTTFVKGGVRVDYRDPSGALGSTVLNGRRKYAVTARS